MSDIRRIEPGRLWMGRLEHNADLLEEITTICKTENIGLGRIEAIGAVKRARLGYYDQKRFEYQYFTLDSALEITSLLGNISIKDDEPMVHAHMTVADENGKTYGGHLAPGTIIFACEVVIQTLKGPRFERGFDAQTRLPLWMP